MLKDTSSSYGLLSRALHWVMALLVLHQFVQFFARVDGGREWIKEYLGSYHGTIGLLILGLALLRLLWVLSQRQRPQQAAGILGVLASLGHKALYLLMLVTPLSAVAGRIGRGKGLNFLDYELVGPSSDQIDWLVSFGKWHAELAIAFAVVVGVHILAALYHHFIKGDDTLRRMTRG